MILTGPQMCPCCGYNLRREVPLIAGRFAYYHDQGFFIDRLLFRPGGPVFHSALGTIMAARGRKVTRRMLAARAGSQALNSNSNSMAVVLARSRKRFAELGVDVPYESFPGSYDGGWAWVGPPVHELAEQDFPPETIHAPTWPPPVFEPPAKRPVFNECG